MNNQQQMLSAEQNALVIELIETYDIEAEDIVFFTGDPKPFFKYEASAVLCRRLAEAHKIEVDPVNSGFPDSIAFKVSLLFSDGYLSSAVGVANLKETMNGKKMEEDQIKMLATSRAIRSALRAAGIDLMKLHNQTLTGKVSQFTGRSNGAALIAQAHILGKEAGLIIGDDKHAWRKILSNRYSMLHSNELSDAELADFVAVLNTLVPQRKAA